MKVLFPTVTIVMTSHCKPAYLGQAVASVLRQTRRDFQLLLVDSGEWADDSDMAGHYRRYHDHQLIDWVTTGQKPGLINRVCPIAFVTNEVIRAGLVRGRYVCSFTDDDLYYPRFVELMAGYLDEHPDALAVYSAQDRVTVRIDGQVEPAGPFIAADGPRGPGQFLGQVDMLQMMYRREVLDMIGDPWFGEEPADQQCRLSDGTFMELVAGFAGLVPGIPETLTTHRYTPESIYSPSR